jgi:hypothetical protein
VYPYIFIGTQAGLGKTTPQLKPQLFFGAVDVGITIVFEAIPLLDYLM